MKNILTAIVLITSVFIINSCENSTTSENTAADKAAYFNSFETAVDTSGWFGEGIDKLADDHSPEGGKSSLHISGGCPQPAASFEVSYLESGNYTISFWAKMGQPEQAATVSLGTDINYANNSTLEVTVKGEEWKYYESENHIVVPYQDVLRVEFFVGGIVFANVYIDNLKIEKVK